MCQGMPCVGAIVKFLPDSKSVSGFQLPEGIHAKVIKENLEKRTLKVRFTFERRTRVLTIQEEHLEIVERPNDQFL